ncbi:Hypothetical protein PHPALM_12215 [Phytophthora palmivora]|uniref:HTH CENPB-type domain-containing protein n=1 Tax=Phytophthora palmivora TaxID=4796 RepID=A0A2P4Y0B8_9STRA|nr:Hypothetical protein PHPALM_12215 [Phytophthora palmivora]
MCSQRKGHHKNLRNIGEAIVDVEEYIVLWLNSMRRGAMLQFKAHEVASERSFPADIFTASYSWRKGFIRIFDYLFVFVHAKDRPRLKMSKLRLHVSS